MANLPSGMAGSGRLPFVSINVATTVDGKLAPRNRHFVPFTSRRDLELLLELRTEADAVMAGARTVDLAKVDLGPGGRRFRLKRLKNGLSEYNLRVVVTGSGTLNPDAEIFRHRFSPIIVLTTERAPKRALKALSNVADEVKVFGEREVDFRAAGAWLRKSYNVRRLLCEGGGELNEGLFRSRMVNQIHWTISPLIFGGRSAPTMVDGLGVLAKEQGARLKLKQWKRRGDEWFLVYSVIRQARYPRL